MVKITCDMCGREIKGEEKFADVAFLYKNFDDLEVDCKPFEMDICKECLQKIRNFIITPK